MMARWVGPVLEAGLAADAVVEAIRQLNEDVTVIDRGAYVRVLVPGRCRVTRSAIEQLGGAPFRLPGDLEAIMPSFQGAISFSEDEVIWTASRGGAGGGA